MNISEFFKLIPSKTLGVQDFSQLKKDYGRNQADVIINTTGNTISGQVTGKPLNNYRSALARSCRTERVCQSTEPILRSENQNNWMRPYLHPKFDFKHFLLA